MFKKIVLGIGISCTVVSFALAQAQNCGDGNQYYTLARHGEFVRYFAPINEFEVSRVAANQVVIKDTVNCRYGRDTLRDINSVEFLDRTLDIEELEIHRNTKSLSLEVLRTILIEKLLAQIMDRGVDPFAKQEREQLSTTSSLNQSVTETTRAVQSGNSLTNPIPSGSYNSLANNSNQIFNTPTNFQPVYYPNNYSYYNPYNSQPSGQYYDSYTGTTFNGSQGYSSPNAASSVIVTWPLSSVGANDIIYFEATDNNNQHHYLGSALGYQGSDTVTIPSFLVDKENLTISVRSGSRTIKTIEVSL